MLRSCAEGTEHLGLVLPEDQFDSWVLGYVGHALIKQICVCIYIYMAQRSNPLRPWSCVSHSTVPLPPCGVVGVWYCPPPPLVR